MELTYSTFVKAIAHEKYYEATFLCLARWQNSVHKGKERDICKGFVNAAASFVHISRGKHDAARKVWQIYEKYRPLITEDVAEYPLLKAADTMLMKQRERLES